MDNGHFLLQLELTMRSWKHDLTAAGSLLTPSEWLDVHHVMSLPAMPITGVKFDVIGMIIFDHSTRG